MNKETTEKKDKRESSTVWFGKCQMKSATWNKRKSWVTKELGKQKTMCLGQDCWKKQKRTVMLNMAGKNIEWQYQILISPSLDILTKVEKNTWKSTLTNEYTTDGWETAKLEQ